MSTQKIPFFRSILFRLSGIDPLTLKHAIPTNKYLFKRIFLRDVDFAFWKTTFHKQLFNNGWTGNGLHHLDGVLKGRNITMFVFGYYNAETVKKELSEYAKDSRLKTQFLELEALLERKYFTTTQFHEKVVATVRENIKQAKEECFKPTPAKKPVTLEVKVHYTRNGIKGPNIKTFEETLA